MRMFSLTRTDDVLAVRDGSDVVTGLMTLLPTRRQPLRLLSSPADVMMSLLAARVCDVLPWAARVCDVLPCWDNDGSRRRDGRPTT